MSERFIIPIADQRYAASVPLVPRDSAAPTGLLSDIRGRRLHDLRISVTDRCNFRCSYCMPKSVFDKHYAFLPQSSLLSFEEIARLVQVFVAHGVEKVRLTGGEPLLRKDIERLIEQLARLRTLDGQPPELTLTTNGVLLTRKAQALKDAGLQRITVSLDALDPATFARMSDSEVPVSDVLDGIEAAQRVGLAPIKVNMVVQKGVNDGEIVPMARHFRGTGVELRFIEFMDVGETNRWDLSQVLPSDDVRARLHAQWPLAPLAADRVADTAQRWAYEDGAGRVGFISSVTQAFCGDCTRLRLSTDGRLYTCLFATQGHDVRSLLRTPDVSDAELTGRLAALWGLRSDRYSELRSQVDSPRSEIGGPRVEMSYIGG